MMFWSALTCQRFRRSRPVATIGGLLSSRKGGVKPAPIKGATGRRTPKKGGLTGPDGMSAKNRSPARRQ